MLEDHRLQTSEMRLARALWLPAQGTSEIRSETLPAVTEKDVLVRTAFSAVSRGTEALVFNGRVPASEAQRMRSPHMGGEFSFPVKYGYSTVGKVEEGPKHLKGRMVFCLHPHQDLFVVEAQAVTPLPDALEPGRAVLAANMETALNIVWDAVILPGDRVAVFGAGVVGALAAFLASRIAGTEVLLVERQPARQALARRLGLDFVRDSGLAGEFDVLINASGSHQALAQALDHAAQEARIIEASWHGQTSASLPLGAAFHSRRLSIVSSQVGSVPAPRRARWSLARRLGKALQLLGDDCLDALISGETAFDELAGDYGAILARAETLCHRIRY